MEQSLNAVAAKSLIKATEFVADSLGYRIIYLDRLPDRDGWIIGATITTGFKTIRVTTARGEAHTAWSTIHELAHVLLDFSEGILQTNLLEMAADVIAFSVMQFFGYDFHEELYQQAVYNMTNYLIAGENPGSLHTKDAQRIIQIWARVLSESLKLYMISEGEEIPKVPFTCMDFSSMLTVLNREDERCPRLFT